MRYATFEVPAEVIADFVREVEEREISVVIAGVSGDDEIVLKVGYEKDEADQIDELEQKLDELVDSLDEEDGEEERDDEDEDRRYKRR